jgi:RNA polymerase sigma-B factor
MTPPVRQARNDRDTATARLLSAYRNNGDSRARDRLVELYMPLVEGLAHRHERRGAEHDDLVQAGSIGLLNAIERFDPGRGDEFVAFAVPTVAGEMKRHLRDRAAIVRLPRSLHEASVRLPRARETLTTGLGRAPSTAELAVEVGI